MIFISRWIYGSYIIASWKWGITVIKKDAETKKSLEGAVFGLYAKEDIFDADGRLIVAADTFIEKAVTGADGTVTFISDLPLGQYYVKEMEAPAGYVKSDKCFDVDASYQGDDVEVIEFEAEFENYPTKLEISKTDITGEHELKGAKKNLMSLQPTPVLEWSVFRILENGKIDNFCYIGA